jgi:hypothetical protein
MLMEIGEVLDRARAKSQLPSDRALGLHLGVDPSSFTQYRRGVVLPSDDVWVRICLAAGITAERGLLHLNIWRSRGRTRTIYRRIAKLWEEIETLADSKKSARTLLEQSNL